MAHRNAVAHADGRHHDRRATRDAHARLGGVRDLVEVDMAGDDLTVCGDNADNRLFHLLFGQAAGAQQRAVGHALCTRGDVVASLGHGGFLLFAKQAGGNPPACAHSTFTRPRRASNRKTMPALFFVKTRDMRVGFYTPTQPPWAASFGYRNAVSLGTVFRI